MATVSRRKSVRRSSSRLAVEICRGGDVTNRIELPDPVESYCRHYNEIAAYAGSDLRARPAVAVKGGVE